VPHATTQQCSQLLLLTSRVSRVYGVHFTAHVRLSHAVDCLLLQLRSAGWPKDDDEGSELPVTAAHCVAPCRNSAVAVGRPKLTKCGLRSNKAVALTSSQWRHVTACSGMRQQSEMKPCSLVSDIRRRQILPIPCIYRTLYRAAPMPDPDIQRSKLKSNWYRTLKYY